MNTPLPTNDVFYFVRVKAAQIKGVAPLRAAAFGGTAITLKIPGDIDGLKVGERVALTLDLTGPSLFGPDGARIDPA